MPARLDAFMISRRCRRYGAATTGEPAAAFQYFVRQAATMFYAKEAAEGQYFTRAVIMGGLPVPYRAAPTIGQSSAWPCHAARD